MDAGSTQLTPCKDPSQRRTALANALNLVRLTGGRNLIFSSAARKAMDLRGPYDVANLCVTEHTTLA